jgi:hypothetical protein
MNVPEDGRLRVVQIACGYDRLTHTLRADRGRARVEPARGRVAGEAAGPRVEASTKFGASTRMNKSPPSCDSVAERPRRQEERRGPFPFE